MQIDIGNIISVVIGGLLVFGGQWFVSWQSTRVETQKWKHDELREIRRDMVKFRENRTKPIIEALDRATHEWDFPSYMELADLVGYKGEPVDTESEEYKKEHKEQTKKRLNQLIDDISAAGTIHDRSIRELVTRVLWQSADPDQADEYTKNLQDAYLQVEKWIFNPQLDYNSLQSGDNVTGSTTQSKKEK